MLDQTALRSGLERLRAKLEEDIAARSEEESAISADLRQRYEAARSAKRTGLAFELWRAHEITQAAVAWLLACVFVRFLEDNDLIEQPWISGPGARLPQAKEQNLRTYRAGQWQTDRDYLLLCFEEIRQLPGIPALFDKEHNPLFRLTPTGHGARDIIDFFQQTGEGGNLVHDFSGTIDNTRFLGDLYQNISETARKRYALVQTPDFVVDFILDRTMEPALQEFGLEGFRIIDPACGSGHFLIAAFERLFYKWQYQTPPLDQVDCASRALASVFGVDVNPFAIAIARFRLFVAALRVCEVKRLSEAPNFKTNLVVGDSLLHGTRPGTSGDVQRHAFDDALKFFYETEDRDKLREYLRHENYHAVVGNPPYITVDDPILRKEYRARFSSCLGTYQVAVPFTERLFELAARGKRSGYVGTITSNAFMKRSFGKKLVEECFPKWDVSHVIDMSGAYLPGHGTPTAIILGRNTTPVLGTVRVVRGIRGEVRVPQDPRTAPVWKAILDQLDRPGSESKYISVADAQRTGFHEHPWSIGGGGAAELKELLDESMPSKCSATGARIGGAVRIGEEEIFIFDPHRISKSRISETQFSPYIIGENTRDWSQSQAPLVWNPYTSPDREAAEIHLWRWRTTLGNRATFQGNMADAGRRWSEYQQYTSFPYESPISIAFANIASHNRFVLNRGDAIFNSTAPVLKLSRIALEDEYVPLLGTLNSSTACFWLRQVCFPKGGDHVGADGARIRKNLWDERFAFDSTKISQLPLPTKHPTALAYAIQRCADSRTALFPENLLTPEVPDRDALDRARARARVLLCRMIALQEELDWNVYHLYGLTEEFNTFPIDQIPEIELGQRAFEIVVARELAKGELETEWFNRHGSTPTTEIPTHWSEPYRQLVQKRIDTIETNRDIALIEQPEYKRRWNLPKWEDLETEALRNWLLDRLEDPRYWPIDPPMLRTVSNLASATSEDPEFLQVAELYTGRSDFKLETLVAELVEKQSIPFLPVLHYKGLGLEKRKQWEKTWELQRREDAGETVEIDAPPKYERTDFLADTGWRLRGKLDVPKERWVSYPHLDRISDSSLLIGWAGYDHAQQAFALAGYYQSVKEDGWASSRLIPVLAGILELLPWVKQWHNAPDSVTGTQAGDFLNEFLRNELSNLNLTEDDLRSWTPPPPQKRSRALHAMLQSRGREGA